MTSREQAAASIRATLDQLKQVVSGQKPLKLSESDTKANFIEKYIEALGYRGLSDITREYYVKNSQEFIDYVLRANGDAILAIEAKALQQDLTDKAAAQLVQYCARGESRCDLCPCYASDSFVSPEENLSSLFSPILFSPESFVTPKMLGLLTEQVAILDTGVSAGGPE